MGPRRVPCSTRLAAFAVAALAAAPAAALSIGQVDDFESGTTLSWAGGSGPSPVETGGPAGAGDGYLQISSRGGSLGTRNQDQWLGDYLGAGITALALDLNNLGPAPVSLRLSLFGAGGVFTSTATIELAAGSGWTPASFGLGADDLTRTQGSGALAQTLADVTTLLIRHDPGAINPPRNPSGVQATLGIDNLRAVPEPGGGALVGLGLAGLAVRPRTPARRSR